MLRLNPAQVNEKLQFIEQYLAAENAADGSKMDANANVTQKKYSDAGVGADERFFCTGESRASEPKDCGVVWQ